jgi:hypothetical protein
LDPLADHLAEALVEHADLFLGRTAWSSGYTSWYKQGRADGQLCMFPASRLVFMDVMKEPRFEDYEIDYRDINPYVFFGNGFDTRQFDGRDLSWYLGALPEGDVEQNLEEDSLRISRSSGIVGERNLMGSTPTNMCCRRCNLRHLLDRMLEIMSVAADRILHIGSLEQVARKLSLSRPGRTCAPRRHGEIECHPHRRIYDRKVSCRLAWDTFIPITQPASRFFVEGLVRS